MKVARMECAPPPVQPYGIAMFPQHPVDGVGVHRPARLLLPQIMAVRPEHRPLRVGPVPGGFQIENPATETY